MIKEVVKHHDPRILLITPLKEGSKISKETKKTIKRNKTPFTWISYMGKGNPACNTEKGLREYRRNHDKMPQFVMKLDNDIIACRGMLDKMVAVMDRCYISSISRTAYAYCSFKFVGAINREFPAIPFDYRRLLHGNYISFNSLIDYEALRIIGGFITDDKYFRLLDWALWLKFLSYGWVGAPVHDCSFTAFASPESVSARGAEDYRIKHQAVHEDFVQPIIDGKSKFKNGRMVSNG